MHRMPRLASLIWIATGVWRWGRGFLEDNVDAVIRAEALFTGDPDLLGDVEDDSHDAADEIFSCDDDCDRYIDDPAAHPALRRYLAFARAPAHGQLLPRPHPRLFADYEGKRVRVTMASRLGDVGVTTDLDAELGYERRVLVRQLGNFSEDP